MTKIEDTQPRQKPAADAPPARGLGRPLDYWLLWLVVLGSLAVNVWLINTLLTVRRQVAQAVSEAAVGLGQVNLGAVEYTVHIDDQLSINAKVPISDTLTVPISQTIPINSSVQVRVPVLGVQTLPFSTKVPIDFVVTIPISRTYEFSTTVPIQMVVPINIPLDETPLGGLKTEAQAYLANLAEELGAVGEPSNPP